MRIICLLLIYIIVSCSSERDTILEVNQNIIIAGEVLNSEKYPDDYTIRIIINDLALMDQRTHSTILNDNGTFKIEFRKKFTQDIYLKYGNRLVTLLVHPGDSLFIKFDADEFINPDPESRYGSIQFSGDAAEVNQDLCYFLPILLESNDIYEHNEKTKTLSPSEFKKYMFARRDEQLEILNGFISENDPCEEFITWANLDISYSCGEDLLRYYWYNPFLNRASTGRLELGDEYYDFFDVIRIDNPSATISASYKNFLHEYYLNLWTKARKENMDVFNRQERDKLLESDVIMDYFIRNSDGFPLEVILTQYFNSYLDVQKDIDGFEELYLKHGVYISNSNLKNTIDEKYINLKLKEEVPQRSYHFIERKQSEEINTDDILSTIIANNKGRVIYIDFWATWCGPCLAEFPYSIELKKVLNKEDVTFVYLCVNSKKDEWENLVVQYKLNGENYLLDNSQYDILSDMFQISGIPHYVLVDAEGEIVNSNAPRPSSPEIENLINELLK